MLNQREELEGKNNSINIKKICSVRIENSKILFLICKEHRVK